MSGNIKKGSKYRSALLENIDNSHPINKGIFMQVHHLISEKAIKDSDTGAFLVSAGYDINDINNLVALPSTLPGACHLEVQLHRGDHTELFSLNDDNDSDDDHPVSYHHFITAYLKDIKRDTKKFCGQDKKKFEHEVKESMDKLSKFILKHISRFNIPLTSIFENFHHDGQGCKNALAIDGYPEIPLNCAKHRDHNDSEHAYYKSSKPVKILFEKQQSYKLTVGK